MRILTEKTKKLFEKPNPWDFAKSLAILIQ